MRSSTRPGAAAMVDESLPTGGEPRESAPSPARAKPGGRRRRAAAEATDWLRTLRPSLVADDGRAPDGTVIVRLSAVDAGGYTHFYDEMIVAPDAFSQALELFARGRIVDSSPAIASPDDDADPSGRGALALD